MGDSFIPIKKLTMRRLVSSQLLAVANYLTKAALDFNHHKIKDKINKIIVNRDNTIPDERGIHLNKIEKEVSEILIEAKRKYHNLRARVVEYSPILLKARLE